MSTSSSVKSIRVIGILIAVVIAISFILDINSASAQTPMKWRYQGTYPSGPRHEGIKTFFCDPIRKASNGRLDIASFPGERYIRPSKAHQYVGKKMVEMSWTCGAFAAELLKFSIWSPVWLATRERLMKLKRSLGSRLHGYLAEALC